MKTNVLEFVYLELIKLGRTDMLFASKTDHLKSVLRNAIAAASGKSDQEVQEHFEEQARK